MKAVLFASAKLPTLNRQNFVAKWLFAAGFLLLLLLGASLEAVAQQDGKRIYQRDALGNIQNHKQSWVVKSGKICPTDTFGNIQHHKPCFAIGSSEFEKAIKSDSESGARKER